MSAGFQVTRAGLDQRLGSVVVAGQAWFEDVQRLAEWLADRSDQDLTALGYAAEEISQIRALTDLENLRKVAYGQQAQPAASNFFFNVEALRGIL